MPDYTFEYRSVFLYEDMRLLLCLRGFDVSLMNMLNYVFVLYPFIITKHTILSGFFQFISYDSARSTINSDGIFGG